MGAHLSERKYNGATTEIRNTTGERVTRIEGSVVNAKEFCAWGETACEAAREQNDASLSVNYQIGIVSAPFGLKGSSRMRRGPKSRRTSLASISRHFI
jgi:hypothetical protein